MTATRAPGLRLRLAILPVFRSTAIAPLTGAIRRHLVNRRFASKGLFRFVPAGFFGIERFSPLSRTTSAPDS